MKLLELSYKTEGWELQNLQLGDVNLLVGKNATGKSRTLVGITRLIENILGKINLNHNSAWNLKFQNTQKDIIDYFLATQNGHLEEQIQVNNEIIFKRTENGEAILKSELSGKQEIVFPPPNRATPFTRRDIKDYPILENIARWAEQFDAITFSKINPVMVFGNDRNSQEYELKDTALIYRLLNTTSKKNVMTALHYMGYEIEGLQLENDPNLVTLYITEKNVLRPIRHYALSQGMFRALSLIIYLEYLISEKKPSTVLIDDLCEGLDYERATKLGNFVFEKCKNSNVQLVATSNDSFLMDVVDIKYWNVLQREGEVVKTLNYKSHPELFEDFKFTGLSNFDFFASDYINQKITS